MRVKFINNYYEIAHFAHAHELCFQISNRNSAKTNHFILAFLWGVRVIEEVKYFWTIKIEGAIAAECERLKFYYLLMMLLFVKSDIDEAR